MKVFEGHAYLEKRLINEDTFFAMFYSKCE